MRSAAAFLILAAATAFAAPLAANDELAAALAALEQNSPEDANAAKSALGGQPAVRQNDDLAAALAALQQNNPEDAAAAKGAIQGEAPRQNDELAAALAALQQNNPEDAAAAVSAGVGGAQDPAQPATAPAPGQEEPEWNGE